MSAQGRQRRCRGARFRVRVCTALPQRGLELGATVRFARVVAPSPQRRCKVIDEILRWKLAGLLTCDQQAG